MKSRKRVWIIVVGVILGVMVCGCIGFLAIGLWAGSDPKVQSTSTARSIARSTGTALAILNSTGSAIPTSTSTQTPIPTNTPTPSATPTQTTDPLFTPPTSTETATNTVSPTPSNTSTNTNTPTPSGTPTKTPTPTKTLTPSITPSPTIAPTAIPPDAGISDWIIYDGIYVGVRDLSWDYYLGYFRAEQGKIYASLYVVVINTNDSEKSIYDNDISLIDGGGQITSGVIFGEKDPTFSGCTLTHNGSCEGWWTTMIVDKPEVKSDLTLRWDPCLIFCDAMDVYIRQ